VNAATGRRLIARHLRCQKHLLALWRHTASRPASTDAVGWPPWVEGRQRLLDRLADHDPAGLAAEAAAFLRTAGDHPLASVLRALHDRQLHLAATISLAERDVEAALKAEILRLVQPLIIAGQARAARHRYQACTPRGPRLDHCG